MRRIILILLFVLCGSIYAQEPKTEPKDTPKVSDDVKRFLDTLKQRDEGLALAQSVLQKERDAIGAEFQRTIAKLQIPGYVLQSDLTYKKDGK